MVVVPWFTLGHVAGALYARHCAGGPAVTPMKITPHTNKTFSLKRR
jgi:hypothetical protein